MVEKLIELNNWFLAKEMILETSAQTIIWMSIILILLLLGIVVFIVIKHIKSIKSIIKYIKKILQKVSS